MTGGPNQNPGGGANAPQANLYAPPDQSTYPGAQIVQFPDDPGSTTFQWITLHPQMAPYRGAAPLSGRLRSIANLIHTHFMTASSYTRVRPLESADDNSYPNRPAVPIPLFVQGGRTLKRHAVLLSRHFLWTYWMDNRLFTQQEWRSLASHNTLTAMAIPFILQFPAWIGNNYRVKEYVPPVVTISAPVVAVTAPLLPGNLGAGVGGMTQPTNAAGPSSMIPTAPGAATVGVTTQLNAAGSSGPPTTSGGSMVAGPMATARPTTSGINRGKASGDRRRSSAMGPDVSELLQGLVHDSAPRNSVDQALSNARRTANRARGGDSVGGKAEVTPPPRRWGTVYREEPRRGTPMTSKAHRQYVRDRSFERRRGLNDANEGEEAHFTPSLRRPVSELEGASGLLAQRLVERGEEEEEEEKDVKNGEEE